MKSSGSRAKVKGGVAALKGEVRHTVRLVLGAKERRMRWKVGKEERETEWDVERVQSMGRKGEEGLSKIGYRNAKDREEGGR